MVGERAARGAGRVAGLLGGGDQGQGLRRVGQQHREQAVARVRRRALDGRASGRLRDRASATAVGAPYAPTRPFAACPLPCGRPLPGAVRSPAARHRACPSTGTAPLGVVRDDRPGTVVDPPRLLRGQGRGPVERTGPSGDRPIRPGAVGDGRDRGGHRRRRRGPGPGRADRGGGGCSAPRCASTPDWVRSGTSFMNRSDREQPDDQHRRRRARNTVDIDDAKPSRNGRAEPRVERRLRNDESSRVGAAPPPTPRPATGWLAGSREHRGVAQRRLERGVGRGGAEALDDPVRQARRTGSTGTPRAQRAAHLPEERRRRRRDAHVLRRHGVLHRQRSAAAC